MKYHADMFLSTCVLLVVVTCFAVAWRGTSSSPRMQSTLDTGGDHHSQTLPSPPEAETESARRPAARQAVEPEASENLYPTPPPESRVSAFAQREDGLAIYVRRDLPMALRLQVEAMDAPTLETFLQAAHGAVQRYNQRRYAYWCRVPNLTSEEFMADASLELAQVQLEQELRDLID